MKNAIAFLLACCVSATSLAKCIKNDAWTGPDKKLHLIVGTFAGSAGTMVFKDPHKGFLLGAGIGLAKELYDAKGGGTCSFQDFAVTALGAAAGAYGTAWLVLPRKDGVFVGYATRF